jgi:hypothetical protein
MPVVVLYCDGGYGLLKMVKLIPRRLVSVLDMSSVYYGWLGWCIEKMCIVFENLKTARSRSLTIADNKQM